MKKIINAPENYVDEMLEGIYVAHPDLVTYVADDLRCLVTANKKEGKVGIATGGGSGHLPLFLGYVGKGMLDGCCVGDVFQSPSAEQMLAVTKAIDSGAGVLYIYGNYNGDIFNFDMAAEMAEFEDGIRVETVLGADDVASGPRPADGEKSIRRGVAGIFFMYKCAGAKAAQMGTLDEVLAAAQKAKDNTRTVGFALTPCIIPEVGHANFTLGENEMAMGMGIHGEPGIWNGPIKTADELAKESLETLLGDMPLSAGEEICLLINGLGATSIEELYILYNSVRKELEAKGVKIYRSFVGEYATSMEMAGASISICRMVDDEMKAQIDLPVKTPFITQA